MFSFIKSIFGRGSSANFKKLFEEGAQIVDVRTEAEFNNGNIRNSRNIPLQNLQQEMISLNKFKPVITCCASGVRSTSAKEILKQNGFEVYNGGSWKSLQKMIYGT